MCLGVGIYGTVLLGVHKMTWTFGYISPENLGSCQPLLQGLFHPTFFLLYQKKSEAEKEDLEF
jgi:hypothetical protein